MCERSRPKNSVGAAFPMRRDFLRAAAVGGVAAATLPLSRSAHAAGSDVIRVGMIGAGGRCAGAAADAMEADASVRLAAVADLFRDRAVGKRDALKRAKPEQVIADDDRCFGGIDGYKHVIDASDIVLIACAAKFHPMYLKAAIAAGKHVFCEKPHAIDPAGIKVVQQACEEARQKNLGVLSGLQSRFSASISETIQRVIDGQIGDVVAIEENFIRGPYGAIQRPKDLRELEVQYGNQYRFSWLCGDDVTQSLVHNLDRATWAMKETPPARCHGLGGRSSSQYLLGDVFDHHSVVYHYANGVRLYALCRTTLNCYNETSSVIMGSKGTALPLAGRITGEKPWKFEGPNPNPYVEEHRQFLKSIREGKPINCGEYMARSTLVAIMGQLSCYSGKEVTWQQAASSDFFFPPKAEDCTWEMEPPTKPDDQGIYPVCATPGFSKNIA